MRRPLVAGNWKMHGTCASIKQLLNELAEQDLPASVDVAVFPGLIHLQAAVAQASQGSIVVGSQDCAVQLEEGAMTGETSALQLKDIGCSMVLVGHSERRQLQEETDSVICRKFIAAQAAGLTPVLCVGETLAEREAGLAVATVQKQVDAVLVELGADVLLNAVIAYEPVWAIGTGETASPEQAQEMHAYIRKTVGREFGEEVAESVSILYGGSVKPGNAREIFAKEDVDGGLIGGASLKAEDFMAIVQSI